MQQCEAPTARARDEQGQLTAITLALLLSSVHLQAAASNLRYRVFVPSTHCTACYASCMSIAVGCGGWVMCSNLEPRATCCRPATGIASASRLPRFEMDWFCGAGLQVDDLGRLRGPESVCHSVCFDRAADRLCCAVRILTKVFWEIYPLSVIPPTLLHELVVCSRVVLLCVAGSKVRQMHHEFRV